ncbi:MAG: DUF3187 family protein [Acidobacteriota bacterium]
MFDLLEEVFVLSRIVVILLALVCPVAALADEAVNVSTEPDSSAASARDSLDPLVEDSVGVPLRIRNFTFPSFVLLGFAPMPATPLGKGRWAVELHFSEVNDFQASPAVEDYLESSRLPGERRPLDATDVAAILALPEGESFYIDGEFSFADFVFHYGVTDRLDIGLGFRYIGYTGGYLDGSIFDFHDEFGFGQQGRQFVADDQFQVVIGSRSLDPVVLLDNQDDSGPGDPSLLFRYFLGELGEWQFSLSGGVKVPIADEDGFFSTGSWDFGGQLNFHRRWNRNALIANLGAVFPGKFEQTGFEPPTLPSFQLSWLHRFGRRAWAPTGSLQFLVAEHPFRDLIDSDLTDLEIQLTAGLKWRTRAGVFGVGLTENLFNYDNTPDIGLHVTWGYLSRNRLGGG